MSDKRELLILGGGLVGMTLALAAARKGIASHVVDRADPAELTAGRLRRPRLGDLDRKLEPVRQHRPRRTPRAARLPDRLDRGHRRHEARPDRLPAPSPHEGSLGRMFANRELRLALFEAAEGANR